MKIVTLALVLVIVSACAATSETKRPIRDVLTGSWGWNKEECQSNPQHYSFSSDGAVMFLKRVPDADLAAGNNNYKTTKYQIIGESDQALRTVIEGEGRRTEDVLVVTWDLILINKYRFCWRRGDWKDSSCTEPIIRCESML